MVLCLETATKNCSVSIVHAGEILSSTSERGEKFVHGERLHVLIKELLEGQKLQVADLDAVCVGKGPGSYTGLRIGVSTAKGLCYAASIPLWSVPTLGCFDTAELEEGATVISVIDARRDEVFAQVWQKSGGKWSPETAVESVVVDTESFSSYYHRNAVIVGDCVSKVARLLGDHAREFSIGNDHFPDAKYMVNMLTSAQHQMEDVAYFEPFYLKDFVAEKSKKKWL